MKKVVTFLLFTSLLFAFDLKDLQSIKKDFVEGNFTQVKNIKNFPMLFKSSGTFEINGSKELFWTSLKPIYSEIKINENGIFILNENKKWQKSSANMDKGLFLDLLSLNEKSIEDVFFADLQGEKSNWTLLLKPKNFFLQKIFNYILIKGDKEIKSFDINETSGDFTEINFTIKKAID